MFGTSSMNKLWVLLLALASPAFAQTPDAYYEIQGRVSVIDGDSLDFRGQRLRLFGIDAPEKRQPCFDSAGKEWACGQRAANLVDEFIADRPVKCHAKDHDRYGRTVVQCWVGAGVDIGEWAVRNGLAVAYRRYASEYIAAEQQARNKHIGVWSGTFEMPWDWRHHQHERN
jgi:endonuclease YncB( thermonuclease family)